MSFLNTGVADSGLLKQVPARERDDVKTLLNAPSASETFLLSDGRDIGFATFGAESGPAVFYLHGFPGSRLSGVFFDDPGMKLGARIISVDRPGLGLSSPQPGRTLVDHAKDIRELAVHLDIKQYGIIGISGGGPYALACAYAIPHENLKAVSVVAGMGPVDVGFKGMNWGNWIIFQGFAWCPSIVRWIQKKVVATLAATPTDKVVKATQAKFSQDSWMAPNPKDFEVLKDPDFIALMLDFNREYYKQGVDGYMEEGRILSNKMDFELEDVPPSVPIQLWYGKQDNHVPLHMGEAIAARLDNRADFYLKDETHLSIVLKHRYDALERLLEKM